jgi:thiamine kinase-like enzyme
MKINLKKYWGIDVDDIKEFQSNNPFTKNKSYIINKNLFLKSENKNMLELRKKEIEILKKLDQKNIRITLPKKNKIVQEEDMIYQLFDFIKYEEFNFEKDIEISNNLAFELAKLSKIKIEEVNKETIFESLCKIENIFIKKGQKREIIKKCFNHLNTDFFPFLQFYNFTLSHGDLHPNNIFKERNTIKSIIDWELVAFREDLYDLAFLIGCIGIQNPHLLYGSWVRELIKSFTENVKPNKLSFLLLPEMVIALRLKWLYKWMIHEKDLEIIDMEAEYLEIMLDNIEDIRKIWLSHINSDFKHSTKKWVMQDSHIIDNINKAKKRMGKFNLDNLTFEKYKDPKQLATDLRLMGVNYGMQDSLIKVLKIRNLLEKLSNKYPDDDHILIEMILCMGNSCLDLSKFGLIDAIKSTINKTKSLIRLKENPELNIGLSFMIRNASIAFAEIKDYKKMIELIEELIDLSRNNPDDIEIKGELARALSNGITSILQENHMKKQINTYFLILEELHEKYNDNRKVHGAYSIAKANLRKKGLFE